MRIYAFLAIAVTICVATACASPTPQRADPSAGPPTGSADERAALAVLGESLRVRAQAARDFDTSRFDQVFVDDASVPLTPLQKDTLTRIAPTIPKAGYLTFQREFYRHWSVGNEAAQRVFAAQKAGRSPDPADVAAAIPAREDPIVMPALRLQRSNVAAARAYLEVETDPMLYRVTLVKVGATWRVAGEDNTPHP
jgi:hypothetical protein